jgi:HPt (histidine-containing phosphotransfer) domain-containing protein
MSDDDLAERTRQAIRGVWQVNRPVYLARVERMEAAAEAARAGTLELAQRREAEDDAHKVAGAVGTFGFPEASRLAKAFERELAGEEPVDGDRLQALAAELRRALEA